MKPTTMNLKSVLGAIVFSTLILLLNSTVAAQISRTETERWREDLAFMMREMEVTHKDLYHTVTRQQLAVAAKRLHDRIPQLRRHQIIVEMMRIVATVGDGHSNIYPTRDAKIGFHVLPIQLYLFSDGVFIRSARKEHANLAGTRVLKIGSVDIDDAVARVRPLVGVDNEMGTRFYVPYLLVMPEVLHAVGLSTSVEYSDFTVEQNGKNETVTLKPAGPVELMQGDTDISWMSKEGWIEMRNTSNAPPLWLRNLENLFWYEFLGPEKTLYVQINEVGNKKDETLADFAKRLAAYINANPVERLVLDFRLNRGGNGTLLKPLQLALVKSKIDEPGKLFVLVGRSTWSASQFFLDWMEQNSHAVFIGEPSASKGNHYGDSRRITLPNSGITVRVSVYYWQHWPPWDTRRWTAPHVTAELSSSDYLASRDPALLAALRYVVQKPLVEILNEATKAGGVELALKRYREFKADPRNKYAYTEQALLEAGDRLRFEKRPSEAAELFKIAVTEYPVSFRGYYAAGVAYNEAGRKDLAVDHLKKALKLNPKSYDAASYLRRITN